MATFTSCTFHCMARVGVGAPPAWLELIPRDGTSHHSAKHLYKAAVQRLYDIFTCVAAIRDPHLTPLGRRAALELGRLVEWIKERFTELVRETGKPDATMRMAAGEAAE
jgi:hypothetical protein